MEGQSAGERKCIKLLTFINIKPVLVNQPAIVGIVFLFHELWADNQILFTGIISSGRLYHIGSTEWKNHRCDRGLTGCK